jgi:PKHD-type hydroxylase
MMQHSFWKWDRVVSPEMCDMLLLYRQKKSEAQAFVDLGGSGVTDFKLRNSKVCWADPNHWSEAILYNHALYANDQAGWNFDIGRPEPVQLASYEVDGFYDWHVDWSPLNCEPLLRKISLSLLLSDPKDFEGGEFEIEGYDAIPLERGSIIAFPSFLRHRVKPVTKGIRYSAVCWVNGPRTL